MTMREAPLAMSRGEFRRAGHELIDRVADFLERLPHGPVTRDESPEAVRALLGGDAGLPATGTDATSLLASTAELLFDHSLLNGHPRFFGYITAGPSPIGILGDLLAAAVNPNTGAWRLSPIATEIEAQTIRWLSELVGMPSGGGLLVSGGNMANMVALVAARRASAQWALRQAGVRPPNAPRMRIYATHEAHTWLEKAADLVGLGTDGIRWIPTDRDQRMDARALQAALIGDRGRGEIPMMVVATAGTVSTGAIDPMFEIGEVCEREDVWMHVDGCYGAVAACLPDAPHDLAGLHLANSLAMDPHKWLYAPLEAGALLVRDPACLRDAFAYHPPYYHFGQQATNYVDLGPQNSRGFRALKIWLALRQVGRAGYVKMIGDDIRLSQWFASRVVEHDELELFTQSLSITTFRYVPRDTDPRSGPAAEAYLDALNAELLDRVQRSGEVFLSHANVRGRYVLRPCIVNFRTAQSDLVALRDTVVRLGRQCATELGEG